MKRGKRLRYRRKGPRAQLTARLDAAWAKAVKVRAHCACLHETGNREVVCVIPVAPLSDEKHEGGRGVSRVSSYDRSARTPEVGSRWMWEPNSPYARMGVEVVAVKWNGEEWWVKLRADDGEYWNDLSRFWEACHGTGRVDTTE